jgi:hypothetical protein
MDELLRKHKLCAVSSIKQSNMQTQVNKPPRLPMGMAGMAIILFCAAGIAAIMGWIPT